MLQRSVDFTHHLLERFGILTAPMIYLLLKVSKSEGRVENLTRFLGSDYRTIGVSKDVEDRSVWRRLRLDGLLLHLCTVNSFEGERSGTF